MKYRDFCFVWFCFILRERIAMYTLLALNSLFFCLCLSSTEVVGVLLCLARLILFINNVRYLETYASPIIGSFHIAVQVTIIVLD